MVLISSFGYSQEIREIGSFNTEGTSWGVDLSHEFALVADESNGICVIDVSDPMRPELVATCRTEDRAQRIKTQGEFAYIADMDGGLRIIDISDPEVPFETGFMDVIQPAQGVAVSGNFVYLGVTRGGVRIIDISDPDNPNLISHCATNGAVIGLYILNDLLYVADWDAGLCVIDVSDRRNPEVIGSVDTPGNAWQVKVQGNYAYLADGPSGLRIIDISDPRNPEVIAAIDTPDDAVGLFLIGSIVFISDQDSGLRLIDVSDPANPAGLAFHDTPDEAHDVVVRNGLAFVADEESGLRIFDVSDFVIVADISTIPEEFDFGPVGYEVARSVEFGVSYINNDDNAEDLNLTLTVTLGERWLSVEPDEVVIENLDTLIFELNVLVPNGFELGDHQGCISITPIDCDWLAIELPVSIFVVEGFGSLSGRLTDAATDEAIPGININLSGIMLEGITDDDGRYSFDRLPAWTYSAAVTVENYLQYNSDEFDVAPDQDVVLDIALLYALCQTDMNMIEVVKFPDQVEEIELSIHNNGNGPLRFTLEKKFPLGGNAEPWELRHRIDVGELCDDDRLQGVEFTGERFFISGGNNGSGLGLIHIFTIEGEYIGAFDQFSESRWGIRDLAWDGEILWGGMDNFIYGFLTDGELETQIHGPFGMNRAITWDQERRLLWVSDINTEIVGITREGQETARLPGNDSLNTFGLATYPEDPDGASIYTFNMDNLHNLSVCKVHPQTGEWSEVATVEFEEGYLSGGVCMADLWDPMSWVLIGLMRGQDLATDEIGIWHISTRTLWLDCNLDGGEVPPEGEEVVELTFNSGGFPVGTVLSAELLIRHNGRGDSLTIPVTMRVVDPRVIDADDSFPQVCSEFYLGEPYPNPFNLATTITYGVPFPSQISLDIYNLSGQRIETLFNGKLQAGIYRENLIAGDLASGLYFIKLEGGGKELTGKVLLIR